MFKYEISGNTDQIINAELRGNNAAFVCPVCGKVYIVSAFFNNVDETRVKGKTTCPCCNKSIAFIEKDSTWKAWIEPTE